jgi:hypothetical protein
MLAVPLRRALGFTAGSTLSRVSCASIVAPCTRRSLHWREFVRAHSLQPTTPAFTNRHVPEHIYRPPYAHSNYKSGKRRGGRQRERTRRTRAAAPRDRLDPPRDGECTHDPPSPPPADSSRAFLPPTVCVTVVSLPPRRSSPVIRSSLVSALPRRHRSEGCSRHRVHARGMRDSELHTRILRIVRAGRTHDR